MATVVREHNLTSVKRRFLKERVQKSPLKRTLTADIVSIMHLF